MKKSMKRVSLLHGRGKNVFSQSFLALPYSFMFFQLSAPLNTAAMEISRGGPCSSPPAGPSKTQNTLRGYPCPLLAFFSRLAYSNRFTSALLVSIYSGCNAAETVLAWMVVNSSYGPDAEARRK